MSDLDAPSSSLRVAMVPELPDVRVARASQSPSRAFCVRTCPNDLLSHAHYVPDSAAPPSAQSFLQNPYYFMFASLAKPDEDIELHWLKVRVDVLFRFPSRFCINMNMRLLHLERTLVFVRIGTSNFP